MSVPRPEGIPPVAPGVSWAPSVRLYLFEPCDRDPRLEPGPASAGERPTFDPRLGERPDAERPA